jgi:hypothetical protein
MKENGVLRLCQPYRLTAQLFQQGRRSHDIASRPKLNNQGIHHKNDRVNLTEASVRGAT